MRITAAWTKAVNRGMAELRRTASDSARQIVKSAFNSARPSRPSKQRSLPEGDWLPGLVTGVGGALRFRLYRPPQLKARERLPLVVMLHGCRQDADEFAAVTRMNRLALKERFCVLYPEQSGLANPQRCWNWFDTDSGRAYAEADLILNALEQVCQLHPVDQERVLVAGLSAGASLAALMALRQPKSFQGVVMHSGIPPGTAHSTVTAMAAMRGLRTTSPLVAAPQGPPLDLPALLVIHGNADTTVSSSNARAAAVVWAEAAGAKETEPRQVQRGKRYPMSVTEFKCHRDTVVTLVTLAGLGHAWSGGAPGHPFSDAHGPDASRMVWAFAKRLFRAPVAEGAVPLGGTPQG